MYLLRNRIFYGEIKQMAIKQKSDYRIGSNKAADEGQNNEVLIPSCWLAVP
jgi:hypothetical protein